MAESDDAINDVLARLGETDASRLDGPLAADMMRQTGLLDDDFPTHRFWLLDPVSDVRKVEEYLPHETFEWIQRGLPVDREGIRGLEIQPGDLLYLIPSRDHLSGKYVFVHRVDQHGTAYTITNVWDPMSHAYRIHEMALLLTGDETRDPPSIPPLDTASFKALLIWRMRDYDSMQGMEEALDRVLNRGGHWMALVKEMGGEVQFERNVDAGLHPASIIKIPIAMLVLASFQDEGIDLAEGLQLAPPKAGRTYEQLLRAMLVLSEETATDILEKDVRLRLGDDNIRILLDGWGATDTVLEPRRSSARDTAILLEGLYQRAFLDQEARTLLLGYLGEITENDKVRLWRLANELPTGSRIYNKRGSLTNPVIVADAGIIELPGGKAYLLCLFGYADEWTTFEELDQIIGDFALTWNRMRVDD